MYFLFSVTLKITYFHCLRFISLKAATHSSFTTIPDGFYRKKKVIPSATYKVTLDPVYMEGGYLSQLTRSEDQEIAFPDSKMAYEAHYTSQTSSVIREDSVQPLTLFLYHSWQERHHFRIPFIKKWYPFNSPSSYIISPEKELFLPFSRST